MNTPHIDHELAIRELMYTPAELAIRERMNPDAARYRDAGHVFEIARVTPGLPFPSIGRREAAFFFTGETDAKTARAKINQAAALLAFTLDVKFGDPVTRRFGSSGHRIWTAELPSGMTLNLVALAEHFEDRDVPAPHEPELAEAAA